MELSLKEIDIILKRRERIANKKDWFRIYYLVEKDKLLDYQALYYQANIQKIKNKTNKTNLIKREQKANHNEFKNFLNILL